MANKTTLVSDTSRISVPAARLAIGTAAATVILLVSLHVLSPELDPSWRMVSEYANGNYGWVLSLMFIAWAVSSWSLALAIKSQLLTKAGKIGLGFLVIAGIGEAMASVFDINNPLHDPASALGIIGLTVAAMLISTNLGRTRGWAKAKKTLLWTANLTWISIALTGVAFAIMIITFLNTGIDMATIDPKTITTLPSGVVGLVGWPNRLLTLMYCLWVATVAWQAVKVQRQKT